MANLIGYFSFGFYPIDFKPWHNDSYVLKFTAMTFLGIHSCSPGFIQDFPDQYVDQCRFNDVHVGWLVNRGHCQWQHNRLAPFEHSLHLIEIQYSGDPEIGPPMGLTERGPILECVRFVKPANFE